MHIVMTHSILDTIIPENFAHYGWDMSSYDFPFFSEHFPYFKTAPNGWKNSVRHNLSLNKCFEKIEKPSANGTNQRKGCLWAMNPEKITKMDEEVKKWSRKDPMAIKKAMVYPHTLEALERGAMVKDYNSNSTNLDSEDEEDPRTPASVSSQVGFQGHSFRGHSGSHGIHRFPKRDPPSFWMKCDTLALGLTQPSMQGSQGYGSTESDFVDIEGFSSTMPDTSLPELNLQVQGDIFLSTFTNVACISSFCLNVFSMPIFFFVLWLNIPLVTLVLPFPRRWVASMSNSQRGSVTSHPWTPLQHRW